MFDDKDWVVDIRLTYSVRAMSPDAALGAVLPLLSLGPDRYGPQPEIADYTVHERVARHAESAASIETPSLIKAVYTAKEVAEILHISVASVYGRIPCMRIGGARRYSRAVIQEILEKGSVPEQPTRPAPVHHERRRTMKPPRVVSKKARVPEPEPEPNRTLTIREAAKMLRISPYKLRQLMDAKKIHYVQFSRGNGKRYLRPDAVQHYIAGGTPRQLVEQHIVEAENDPAFRDEQDMVARVAAEWRKEWPE